MYERRIDVDHSMPCFGERWDAIGKEATPELLRSHCEHWMAHAYYAGGATQQTWLRAPPRHSIRGSNNTPDEQNQPVGSSRAVGPHVGTALASTSGPSLRPSAL